MGTTQIALAATLLLACGTPYQREGILGGYDDYPAGAGGAVMVTFNGNGYTSEGAVLRMWHQRAAEICHGSDRYVVLDGERSSDTQLVGGSTSTTNVTFQGNQATATTHSQAPTQVTRHKVQGLIRCVAAPVTATVTTRDRTDVEPPAKTDASLYGQ